MASAAGDADGAAADADSAAAAAGDKPPDPPAGGDEPPGGDKPFSHPGLRTYTVYRVYIYPIMEP